MQRNNEVKPKRLIFKTYLQLIKNSVGTSMFRNFYLETPEAGVFDGLGDGRRSCAFYVSSILKIFDIASGVHGTIQSTLKDIEENGWEEVEDIQPGDIVVWEPRDFSDGTYRHIGFALSGDRAISASEKEKQVVEHDMHFSELQRPIERIYRYRAWDKV